MLLPPRRATGPCFGHALSPPSAAGCHSARCISSFAVPSATARREQFSELQMVKSEVEYTQQLCDQCAQELIMEFNEWYIGKLCSRQNASGNAG